MSEKRLSDLAIRNAKPLAGRREKMLGDGGNLFLRLRPESREWMYVWKVGGTKRKLMPGPLADLCLAEAREKARVTRGQVAGHLLADLLQMFQFAVLREMMLMPTKPTNGLRKQDWNGQATEPDRVLSEDEIRSLLDQLPATKLIVEIECAIWIMLSTACSVGELSRARWEYIADKQPRLPKEATKTDRGHAVDLSPFALK